MPKPNGQPSAPAVPSQASPVMVRAVIGMSRHNEAVFSYLVRRLREKILKGEQERADGGVQISLTFSGGNLSSTFTVQERYTESMSGAAREPG